MDEPDFQELVEHANDVFYLHDLEGRFLWVNQTAQQLFGYTLDEFRELSIARFVHPDDLDTARAQVRAKAEGKAERSAPYPLRVHRKDGAVFWLEVSTRVLLRDGRPWAVQGIGRDITDRRRAEAAQELVRDMSGAVQRADDLEDGLAVTVQAVCRATGWDHGEAWLVGPDGLEPARAMYAGRPGLEKFQHLSAKLRFAPGEGIPGLVAQQGRSMAVQTGRPHPEFRRGSVALAAGLQAALAVPVAGPDGVIAVLMFFHAEERPEDAGWREVVEAVAAQLGATLARCDREQRLRRRLLLLAGCTDDGVPILLTDLDGMPIGVNRAFLDVAGVADLGQGPVLLRTWPQLLASVDDARRLEQRVEELHEMGARGEDVVLYGARYGPERRRLRGIDDLEAAHAWRFLPQTMRSSVSNENPSGPTS